MLCVLVFEFILNICLDENKSYQSSRSNISSFHGTNHSFSFLDQFIIPLSLLPFVLSNPSPFNSNLFYNLHRDPTIWWLLDGYWIVVVTGWLLERGYWIVWDNRHPEAKRRKSTCFPRSEIKRSLYVNIIVLFYHARIKPFFSHALPGRTLQTVHWTTIRF